MGHFAGMLGSSGSTMNTGAPPAIGAMNPPWKKAWGQQHGGLWPHMNFLICIWLGVFRLKLEAAGTGRNDLGRHEHIEQLIGRLTTAGTGRNNLGRYEHKEQSFGRISGCGCGASTCASSETRTQCLSLVANFYRLDFSLCFQNQWLSHAVQVAWIGF